MSKSFSRVALDLASLSARALGWRPLEFWAATPIELATALGLGDAEPFAMLDRDQLQRLMDMDNDRPG